MASLEIQRFLQRLKEDEALRARVDKARSVDEIIALARKNGYTFDTAAVRARAQERDLTDAELEQAGGGATEYCFAGTNFCFF